MNPIVSGWYADPEARFYAGRYYIYVTKSFSAYGDQMNIDAFSSDDLTHWKKHENILDMSGFPYIHRAVWAPTIADRNGKYYLIFASNDIQNNDQYGGLEIAVSDSPAGPFNALLGHPLIDRFINYAQPIDGHLFKDDDGTVYLYWGGWQHCNVAIMRQDMMGFEPLPSREWCKAITPPGYVEGPCMLKRNGLYHFMWSAGDWVNGSYHVSVSTSISPLDISEHGHIILQSSDIAEGPGHNGYLNLPGTDHWKIVYHRRIIGDRDPGHRVLCMDDLQFDGDYIHPVRMT